MSSLKILQQSPPTPINQHCSPVSLVLNFRELKNEIAEKAAALERARVLKGRLRTESERAHRESELVYQVDAAWRQLFQNYQAKSEEHVTLLNNFDMVKEEKIGKHLIYGYLQIFLAIIKPHTTFNFLALENQVDHLMRTLAEEKQHNGQRVLKKRSA